MSLTSGFTLKDAEYKVGQTVKLSKDTMGSKRGPGDSIVERDVVMRKGSLVQVLSDMKMQDTNKPRSSMATGVPTLDKVIYHYRVSREMDDSWYVDTHEPVDGQHARVPHKDLASVAGGTPNDELHRIGVTLYFLNPNPLTYKHKGQNKSLCKGDRVFILSDAVTHTGRTSDVITAKHAYYYFKVVRPKGTKYIWKCNDYLLKDELTPLRGN